ncbi:MAG: 30S ribosomal protein S19e [Candidatus Aenigmarchaeota archaeon]|nr:30S ribosomal protein S19e [Candidatus Aenigmarchaeota archaeon]
MTTAQELTEKIAKALKRNENIKPPEWSIFVKTGVNKERPPTQPDWWYLRCGAILKKIYKNGPVGVNRLRSAFSSRKRRGHKPPHTYKAGGKIIRLMVQQLENAGLVKKAGKRKGRVVTPKGQSLVDRLKR